MGSIIYTDKFDNLIDYKMHTQYVCVYVYIYIHNSMRVIRVRRRKEEEETTTMYYVGLSANRGYRDTPILGD